MPSIKSPIREKKKSKTGLSIRNVEKRKLRFAEVHYMLNLKSRSCIFVSERTYLNNEVTLCLIAQETKP